MRRNITLNFPRLKVDMKKLTTNVEVLVGKAKEKNISVMGVTKVFVLYQR